MVIDEDVRQRLNLVRTNRSFVIQEKGATGAANVVSPTVISEGTGIYWIAGKTTTNSGRSIDSVFRVDTNSGCTLLSIYWWINGRWFRHDGDEALRALQMPKDEVFPVDWQLDVSVEKDAFH